MFLINSSTSGEAINWNSKNAALSSDIFQNQSNGWIVHPFFDLFHFFRRNKAETKKKQKKSISIKPRSWVSWIPPIHSSTDRLIVQDIVCQQSGIIGIFRGNVPGYKFSCYNEWIVQLLCYIIALSLSSQLLTHFSSTEF